MSALNSTKHLLQRQPYLVNFKNVLVSLANFTLLHSHAVIFSDKHWIATLHLPQNFAVLLIFNFY